MTSSTPRRCYLSRVVHVGLLSHDTGTSLTHRLPLRLTEPTLTQYSPFFPITTDYHLKTFTTPPSHPARYTRCNSPPINDHCTNHRVMAHCSAVLMCLCRVKPLVFSVCLITCLWCVLLCTAVMTSEKKFPCGMTSRPHAMQCTGVVMLVLFCSATATAELNLPYYVCVEQLLKSISRKHGGNSNQHQRQVTNSDK